MLEAAFATCVPGAARIIEQPRELLRTSGDAERKRQAAVAMLEARTK